LRHEITNHPTLEVDDGGDRERDQFGYYKCHCENCQLVFTTDSTRKRQLKVNITNKQT